MCSVSLAGGQKAGHSLLQISKRFRDEDTIGIESACHTMKKVSHSKKTSHSKQMSHCQQMSHCILNKCHNPNKCQALNKCPTFKQVTPQNKFRTLKKLSNCKRLVPFYKSNHTQTYTTTKLINVRNVYLILCFFFVTKKK